MMNRFHLILTICISLLLLNACNRPQTPTTENSPTTTTKVEEALKTSTEEASNQVQSAFDKAKSATEKASQTAQTSMEQAKSAADKATQSASETIKGVMSFKEGLQAMSTGVSNTLKAVNTSDFTVAQQEFAKVQENWAKSGEMVKTKSTKVYQQVDSHLTKIANFFKEPNPDRTKLMTELQALGKTITNSFSEL